MAETLIITTLGVRTGIFLERRSLTGSVDLPPSLSRLHLPVSLFAIASVNYLRTDERPDGGTESIAITAGETQNPAKNLPRVVKNVFWRILLF